MLITVSMIVWIMENCCNVDSWKKRMGNQYLIAG